MRSTLGPEEDSLIISKPDGAEVPGAGESAELGCGESEDGSGEADGSGEVAKTETNGKDKLKTSVKIKIINFDIFIFPSIPPHMAAQIFH